MKLKVNGNIQKATKDINRYRSRCGITTANGKKIAVFKKKSEIQHEKKKQWQNDNRNKRLFLNKKHTRKKF